MKKQQPEYLNYKSEAPRAISWLIESRYGAFVFFGALSALGALVGLLIRWLA